MPDTAFAGLELLETATLAVSRDGSIRYVNPACENLLALSQKELLKHTLSTLFIDGRALWPACAPPWRTMSALPNTTCH